MSNPELLATVKAAFYELVEQNCDPAQHADFIVKRIEKRFDVVLKELSN